MKRYLILGLLLVLVGAFLFTKSTGEEQPQNIPQEPQTQKEESSNNFSDRKKGTDELLENKEKSEETSYEYKETTIELVGNIKKVERIAEDIPYDYIIVTDEKVVGWDSTGLPGGVNELYIVSEPTSDGRVTPEVISQLKDLEGKRVMLTAIVEWGYAEHAQLLVQEIKEL